MLSALPSELHLWWVFCEQARSPGLLAQCRAVLNEAERRQEQRFLRAADRHRYLLTRASIRYVLSQYVPLAPADWSFTSDAHGRPRIDTGGPSTAHLHFNISHTDQVILIGIGTRAQIGVDVETHDPGTPILQLAERYFALFEYRALCALPERQQRAGFFDLWTLKEAYTKALGLGLNLPLRTFGFELQGERVRLHADAAVDTDPGRWQFWLLRPGSEVSAAVCASRETPLTLLVRQLIPMVGYEDFACRPIAVSADAVSHSSIGRQ